MQRSNTLSGIALVFAVALVGCDIFDLDNYDEPTSPLTGQITYEGQPVGVRGNAVELELWQPGPEFELNTKIPVHVDQDGSFTAMVFDGSYEVNLLRGSGPWVDDPARIPVEVAGETTIEVPVVPYHTIENEQITFNPSGGTNGAIEATFNVRQVTTSSALEFVGLYIGETLFVDRERGLEIASSERERTRAQVQAQLDANTPITISVNLPEDIYETGSPAVREHVFVRVGVRTEGVQHMLFTQVHKVDI